MCVLCVCVSACVCACMRVCACVCVCDTHMILSVLGLTPCNAPTVKTLSALDCSNLLKRIHSYYKIRSHIGNLKVGPK